VSLEQQMNVLMRSLKLLIERASNALEPFPHAGRNLPTVEFAQFKDRFEHLHNGPMLLDVQRKSVNQVDGFSLVAPDL